MDYAIQLLIPIMLGIFLGVWLHDTFDASPIWTVLFAIIGMFAGIGILYKRSLAYAEKIKAKTQQEQAKEIKDSDDAPTI